MRQLTEGHNEQMKIWNEHITEMTAFSEACRMADDQLEDSVEKLTALSKAIEKLTSTNTSADEADPMT